MHSWAVSITVTSQYCLSTGLMPRVRRDQRALHQERINTREWGVRTERACVWLLWAEIAGCRWLVSPSRARGLSWEIEWLLVCNTDITSSSNLIILMHAPSPAPPAIKYEGLIIIFWMWLLGMKNNNTLGYINMKVVAELWPIGLIIVFSFSRLDLFIAGRN